METPRQKARWGVVSSIGLADLVVREVPVKVTSLDAVHTHAGFIGQGILAQGPWEIDWDGGTLTLGASPWPSAPDVTVVPLRRADERDVVTLIVDGHAIDAAVDTGARYSMISEDAAKRAGLAARPVKDLAGSHEAITADVQLGALRLGRIELRPRRITGFGAFLGLDVLGGFGIQVLPGKQLALRPRGGAWESAARRLARWPWLRGCSSPGCVRAHAEAAGNDLRLTFSLEVEPPYPVGLLLGCADVEAPGSRVPTLYEALASHGRRVFEPRHVFVRVPAAPKDRPLEALIADGAMRWARLGCRDLSVLDVLPISEDGAAGTPSACFQEGTAGAPSACFTL